MKTTYTYNGLGQVTRLLNAKLDTTTLSDFSGMTYDGAGNLKTMISNLPSTPSYSGTTNYTYNSKDQLTQEASTRLGGYTNNFGFDNAGNATSFKGVTQTFNSKNQNTANTYDLNGNPTTYKGATSSFDAENRLTSFGSTMTAGYTAGGLRAWKQNASGRTYQLYAGGVIPVCQLDSSGNVISANTVADTGLLSTRTTASAFYAFDIQGNASHRLDGSGSTLSTSTFDAFGVRATNDTSGDPFSGFGGQNGYRSEAETGLQLLGLQYYDPASGSFLNRDPIVMAGGVNVYEYTDNLPIGRSDSLGLDWLDCMVACIQKHDPLNNWGKGGLGLVGGPIPKSVAKLCGVRIIILPGGSRLTTLPSIIQQQTGLPLRKIGRVFFWIFIGYGLWLGYCELHCLAECSGNPESN